jgi:hypothetical protein
MLAAILEAEDLIEYKKSRKRRLEQKKEDVVLKKYLVEKKQKRQNKSRRQEALKIDKEIESIEKEAEDTRI